MRLCLGWLIRASHTYHHLRHSCRAHSRTSYVQTKRITGTPRLPDHSALAPPLELSVGPRPFSSEFRFVVFAITAKAEYFLLVRHPPIAGSGRHQANCLRGGIECSTHKYLMWPSLVLPAPLGPGPFGKCMREHHCLDKGALSSSGTRPIMSVLCLLASLKGNKTCRLTTLVACTIGQFQMPKC